MNFEQWMKDMSERAKWDCIWAYEDFFQVIAMLKPIYDKENVSMEELLRCAYEQGYCKDKK